VYTDTVLKSICFDIRKFEILENTLVLVRTIFSDISVMIGYTVKHDQSPRLYPTKLNDQLSL